MTGSTPTYTIGNIDLSDIDYSITLDTSTFSGGFNGVTASDLYTVGTAISKEPTDIVVAGKSLKKFMDSVEERLAILEPNEKLEAEWAELKELGEQYRSKEREIKEKMKTWNILKKDS